MTHILRQTAALTLPAALALAFAGDARAVPAAPRPPEPSAAAPQVAPLTLSLEEALARGEENVPLLVRARNDQRATEARRAGAAVLQQYNPLATFLGGYRRETTSSPAATGFQYQVHLEQQLEIAGQRGARLRAVDAAIDAARAGTEYARGQVRALLSTLYVRAVVADQRVAVARGREETALRLLESASVRGELGAASEIEVNLARIEEGRVAGEVTSAQLTLAGLLNELRVLCGIPGGTPLRLTGYQGEPPALSAETHAPERLVQLAHRHRADYRGVQRQRLSLGADRARLQREVVPNPILAFDHQRDLPGQDFYGGTVGLALPLWNRNQGPLAQVRAAELARQSEERLLTSRIEAEVGLALQRLRLLADQAQRFRLRALPPAQRNLELLQRGWQAGKFDLFRVITASRELTETRLRYLDILDDLWEAAIELERAVGTPIFIAGGN